MTKRERMVRTSNKKNKKKITQLNQNECETHNNKKLGPSTNSNFRTLKENLASDAPAWLTCIYADVRVVGLVRALEEQLSTRGRESLKEMTRRNNKKCRRRHRAECEEQDKCEQQHQKVEKKTRKARSTKGGAASNSDVPCPCPCPCPPEEFDVVIVGSGPHGLAVLSALSEKRANLRGWEVNYDLNHNRSGSSNGKDDNFNILVIDPTGWMHCWNKRFENLRIEWLRSPYHAHPDATEDGAMLTYAQTNQIYTINTKPIDTFWESESSLKGQFLLGSGLFDLPSSALFSEFCDVLLERYPHTFHQSSVVSVSPAAAKEGSPRVRVKCSDKSSFVAKHVVFAMGAPGGPNIPPNFVDARLETFQCKEEEKESARPCEEPPMVPVYHMVDKEAFSPVEQKGGKVLVVGGGLSAVQTALRFASEGNQVYLCSRRPLVPQVFDLPLSFLILSNIVAIVSNITTFLSRRGLTGLKRRETEELYLHFTLSSWKKKGELNVLSMRPQNLFLEEFVFRVVVKLRELIRSFFVRE